MSVGQKRFSKKMLEGLLQGTGGIFSPADSAWFACYWGEDQAFCENSRKAFFTTQDFFSQTETVWRFQEGGWFLRKEIQEVLESELQGEDLGTSLHGESAQWEPSPLFFKQAIVQFQESLQETPLKKVVPWIFRFERGTLSWKQRGGALLQLLKKTEGYPFFLYGLWKGDEEGLLGATPELLLEKGAPPFCATVALAGTRLEGEFSSWNPLSLLDRAKELQEHEWVVRGIEEGLRRFWKDQLAFQRSLPPLSFERGKTEEVAFPGLWHLKTPLRFPLPSAEAPFSWRLFVNGLHPTPALGGYPQKEAWEWLLKYEQEAQTSCPRGLFGGPFGFFESEERGWVVVAIRNLQWTQGQIRIGAGCGVIESSQPEEEWREAQGKVRSVCSLMGGAF